MINSTSIRNLAVEKGNLTIDLGGPFSFEKTFFRQAGENSSDKVGSLVDESLLFDGYTCIDNKEKLYIKKSDSYVSSIIQLTAPMNQYTIELWIKATQGLLGENNFLTISDNPRSSQKQYLSIVQEDDGILACSPA